MAPKKGTGAKKKKKPTIPMEPFEYTPPTVLDLKVKPPEFIRVRICNVSLTHLNFEWPIVPNDVTLSAIKDAITKRHGGTIVDLVLYKDAVNPASRIRADDSTTLKDLGVLGAVSGLASDLPALVMYYDFKGTREGDALMAADVASTTSKHGLNLKQYLRETRSGGLTR